MDSYREHPSDFNQPASDNSHAEEVAAAIGTDERRMHVRAYNYWVSLLDGRDFPTIDDLDSSEVQDFAANSLLLDFTCGSDNPAIPYVGPTLRDECGLDDDMRTIADVPSRSLLSRLTDHYMQIIANRAPVGFEAEFENQRSQTICYRGILMPFSSDGDSIDFIYGVINWKRVGEEAANPAAATEVVELDIAEIIEEREIDAEAEQEAEIDIAGFTDEPEASPSPASQLDDDAALELTDIVAAPPTLADPGEAPVAEFG